MPSSIPGSLAPATAQAILEHLAPFVPNSSGSLEALFDHTLNAASQIGSALAELVRTTGASPLPVMPIQSLHRDIAVVAAGEALADLFRTYGSDKSTAHDYHILYGMLLAQPKAVAGVLEIGIGSNDPSRISNLGPGGRPGASLRAFRDWLPNAAIHGADADTASLFEEPRIRTHFVDQTAPLTLAALGEQIEGELDLIIDDGLHAPNANVLTLAFALTRVRAGGWVVIEDIPERALPIWQVVAALLPSWCQPKLIGARGGYLFVVQRLDAEE